MTAPQPDDLAAPRRRHEPETPAQHAERMRILAERRQRVREQQRQRTNAGAERLNREAAS